MARALTRRLLDVQTLKKAWQYVRDDTRDDFIEDVIRYSDYGQNLPENVSSLSARIANGSFYPTALTSIDVPKTEMSTRPGSVPDIEDRIVAHAIVYLIAPRIDRRMSNRVYSYRLKKNYEQADRLFEDNDLDRYNFLKKRTIRRMKIHDEWYRQWPEYDAITKYFYEEEQYSCLALTDISAYFENIQHDLLRDRLLRYVPDAIEVVDLLMTLIHRWSIRLGSPLRAGRGIPQGTEIGSFLGNVFLMPLDERMADLCRGGKIEYFRYMDDTKIFTKSKSAAVEAVLAVERTVRNLQLNLQGAKSVILEGEKIRHRLFDPRLDALNKCFEEVQELDEIQRKRKRKVFEKGFVDAIAVPSTTAGEAAIEERLLKRRFTAFKTIGSSRLADKALTTVEQRIEYKIVTSALDYLTHFPKSRSKLVRLLEIYETREGDGPEYWRASIIRSLRFHLSIPESFRDALWLSLMKKKTHWYSKVQIAALLALYPQTMSRLSKVVDLFWEETNGSVRRALLVMLTQLSEAERERVFRRAAVGSEPSIIRFVHAVDHLCHSESLAGTWAGRIANRSFDERFLLNNAYVLQLIGRCESFRRIRTRTIKALWSRAKGIERTCLKNCLQDAAARLEAV